MKKIAASILALSCLLLTSAHAITILHQDGSVTQTDPRQKSNRYSSQTSRLDYYDELGRHQGHSEKERFSDRTNHYNEWYQRQGYSERDNFSGEIRHYNEWGQLEGTVKPSRW